LLNHAFASIVVGTVTVLLLKLLLKLLLEVDAVTVASGGPSGPHRLTHHSLGLN